MARLYVLSGPDLGKSFEIEPGATLGRSTDCAVVLRDHSVSRQHARLECHDGRWSVVDLDSRNGLFVGEAKQPRAALADGAEFKLGEVLCRFRADAAAPAPVPVPAAPRPPVEDEIVLESAEEPELELPDDPAPDPAPARVQAPAPARPPAPPPFPKPANPSPELVCTARRPTPGFEQRDRGVLQYSKVEAHGGFLQEELSQQPWYLKIGVWILALALCALAAWAAFHATSFFKEKVVGPETPVDSPEPR